ncbi:hypothetical protein INT48_008484 [Thamnidium elegans]|uniref:Mitochondrial phosphate carrier protein n=1 Tax=Thamnidium elegans TaxID=101142 RepID=A0A8H7VTX7_9FUNG|nr:hypothetical protein INT48_008484 [Thamnidium elegans]
MISETSSIPLYSKNYFLACSIGGILACGPTHMLVTPLDLVKCRTQVQPGLYKGVFDGWKTITKVEGFRGLFTGIGPTAIGYSLQGAGKYGFYEVFKYKYSNLVGEEAAHKHRTLIFLGASASAELIADVLLCPMEALKVPYTMVKFASFEKTVEILYKTFMTRPKHEYNKSQQLGVSFAGGYIAGVLCAVVSHPADVLVSKLNNLDKVKAGEHQTTALEVIKKLGLRGLWTGLGPRIFMIGTLTGLQWLIYDTFKVAVGLPTSGSSDPAPAENIKIDEV